MPVGFSEVTVCNMALSHVGSKSTIESIDEKTPGARECKLWYDTARLVTLEGFNWVFAKKSQTLTAHAVAAPTRRFAYRYQMPVDCVAPREIENPAGPDAPPVPFQVENAGDGSESIITDMDSAVLLYTYNLSTVALFSVQFIDTFALQLASRIGYKLSGKASVVRGVTKAYDAAISSATLADALKTKPREETEAASIKARY